MARLAGPNAAAMDMSAKSTGTLTNVTGIGKRQITQLDRDPLPDRDGSCQSAGGSTQHDPHACGLKGEAQIGV